MRSVEPLSMGFTAPLVCKEVGLQLIGELAPEDIGAQLSGRSNNLRVFLWALDVAPVRFWWVCPMGLDFVCTL